MTLMNAMMHLSLGMWKGRMLTSFGFGNAQNIVYGILNFEIAIGLFVYKYGFDNIWENKTILGASTVFLLFLIFGKTLYKLLHKNQNEIK